MSFSVACPSCGAKLLVRDAAAGRTLKCPKCRNPIPVTAITRQPATPPSEEVNPVPPLHMPPHAPAAERVTGSLASAENVSSPPEAPPPPVPVAQLAHEERTKACPFCGETVLAVAKKCKHCGEIIDMTLRIAEEAKRAADRRDPPAVYMNAGGGGGGASSASSSAAASAASGGSRERVKITLQTNWPFIGIGCAAAFVLGLIALVLFLYVSLWAGFGLLFAALVAAVGGGQRTFNCSFCERTCNVPCFTPTHKCARCGLLHVIKWE